MRTCVILNPTAGNAERARAIMEISVSRTELTVLETDEIVDAALLSRRAMEEGYDLIVAAGGDGTIHEVINGISPHFQNVILGILPLGTGNDLARTLAIPPDPLEALQVLYDGAVRAMDLILMEFEDRRVYCSNVSAGGYSGQINEILTPQFKASWGPLAYLLGAIRVLPDLTDYRTTITFDDGPSEAFDLLNMVVANGRTVAGGKRVAPMANPEDGLMDVVIVRYDSPLELAELAARLLSGTLHESEHVVHRRVRRLHVSSEPGMWFNADGELLTKQPISFSIVPRALKVITGKDYTPEP